MISFSAQRCTQFFRSISTLFSGLVIFVSLGLSAQAQSNDELFRGIWQVDTPDKGALIMIVKSQGRAAYFWGDNTDRTVYQGNWTSNGEIATFTWQDGGEHRLERDRLGFGATYIDASGHEQYIAQAQQVPTEILGQWAKPPSKEKELISDRDKAKGFFGIWQVGKSDAAAEYVFVEPDRSAATTEGDLRGSWAKQGSELHIAWDSGHYSILRPNNREFAYKIIAPGKIIEDDETEMRPTARTIEEKIPASWMAEYQKEREIDTEGIAFSSRKNARAFYRGDWIVKLSEGNFERIEISRFGGLSTSTDDNLSGDWKMQGQDIFMRWDHGMRKILSPIGRGFVLYEYKPGRPLDGVPTRLRPAAPADRAKLTEHLKGRKDVARQMISMAEAAGIDPNQQGEAGWGRTFSRWIWPFSEEYTAASSDAILAEEFEQPGETDPWWWPFWSEKIAPAQDQPETESNEPAKKPITAPEFSPATTAKAESDTSDVAPEIEGNESETQVEKATEESATPEKKPASARGWIWPF